MNTQDFLLDLGRRRRYRGLTPGGVVEAAAERVVDDESPAVLRLAMISNGEAEADQLLEEILAELSLSDVGDTLRSLEARRTCEQIVDGSIPPLEGGAQLQALFYEDESNELLRGFWSAMAESDDLAYRPELEVRIRELARAALGQLGS